jgi:hypothetical protein
MTYTQNTSRGVGATLNVVNRAILLPVFNSCSIVIDRITSGKLGVNRIGWMDDGWIGKL